MVKTDLDTLPTVPEDPPADGPDRALDPPPLPRGAPAECSLDAGWVADADGDSRSPTESPIIGSNIAAVTMVRHFALVSTRRTLGSRRWVAVITAADQSGNGAGGGGAESSSWPECVGADVVSDVGRLGRNRSGLVWSLLLMLSFLFLM
jgi:hypothetical protein